ncbi:MAG: hypothetical protein RL513_494 [Pseudomonadota bacterium]|jgi:hypothetical protein
MLMLALLILALDGHAPDCACDGCCVFWTGEPLDLTPVRGAP